MIKHEGSKWVLYTSDGSKVLGTHDTEAEALAQERAIEASKHRSAEDLRQLHLRGALGAVRTEMWQGREHLVVPVVALQEGVIHAVNAETPELVPAATLAASVEKWNGHPSVVGHPVKDGRQCSAYTDTLLTQHGFGLIRGAHMRETRLGMEALIDPARLETLGQQQLLADLRAGKPVEVSVGAFVRTAQREGTHNGKPYKAEWLEIVPDHLAFLPGGRGACSLEMGCGAHRAAMHLVTAEGIEELPDECEVAWTGLATAFTALKKFYKDCEACDGTGTKDGNPCAVCEGKGQLKTAAGARHSATDREMIQTVHDHATALGATCDRANYKLMEEKPDAAQLRAACSCEGKSMSTTPDTKLRDEIIAALVTHDFSTYKAGDEAYLQGFPEARLQEFKANADGRKVEAEAKIKAETDLRTASARITALEGKLEAATKPPTQEEWLAKAPAGIKTLLDRQAAAEAEEREGLILKLAERKVNTDEELKAMDIAQLRMAAKYAKVDEPPVDFSGRGLPTPRGGDKGTTSYAPPDSYAEPLKALRARVN